MGERITTALDVLGVLLVAAGVAWTIWPRVGPLALAFAGAIILAASFMSARVRREPAPGEEGS